MGVILSVGIGCRPLYRVEEHIRQYETLDEALAREDEFPLQQFFLIPWMWRCYAQHRRETQAARSKLAFLYRWYWQLGLDVGLHLVILALARAVRRAALTRWFYSRVLPLLVIRRWRVIDEAESMLVMRHDLFRHIEIEIFVPLRHVTEAASFAKDVVSYCAGAAALTDATTTQLSRINMLDELRALQGQYVHHYPICFRKVLPDDADISMAAGTAPYYAISFISFERPEQRQGFLKFAEFLAHSTARLFGARPHWGKVCPIDHETVKSLYPSLPDFQAACRRYDPLGAFVNEWIETTIGLTSR
jgi:hypothetical protein